MEGVIDALGHRLEILMDGIHFKSDFDETQETPERLIDIGKHNLHEYEKIEAMDVESQERIRNLFANILASRLQEEAIVRYGNTNSDSTRQVLHEWFNKPEDQAFWNRLRETMTQTLLGLDLTEEQCTSVLVHIYDKLPNMLVEYIEELIVPIHMLPRSEAQPIAMALVDLMKEGENDDCR